MLKIVFLLVFSAVSVYPANSAVLIEIRGMGLTLVNDTLPYKQKYSYTFKEPGHLNVTCTVSGSIQKYALILQNECGIGTSNIIYMKLENSRQRYYSESYTFKLTPESRTISCTARAPWENLPSFTSTVDLKYEPDSTTAPSISATTKPTAPVPIEPTTCSAEPQTPANSAVLIEIRGMGLTLVNDTLPYKQKYSYTFKEPGHLNLTCTASGLIYNYLLILQDERGIGTIKLFYFGASDGSHYSVSYTFKLTSGLRTISCTARNNYFDTSKSYTSTVDLKYEPDSTTAPSISATTKPTAPVPTKPTTGPAKPQTPATTKPTAPVLIEPTTGSGEPQTPGDSVKNIVIACLCFVIVVGFIVVIIRNRCFRTQVNPNKMAKNIMSRPPMDLPPEIEYEEVYSHGAGLQRPRRQRAPGAAPQHPQDYAAYAMLR